MEIGSLFFRQTTWFGLRMLNTAKILGQSGQPATTQHSSVPLPSLVRSCLQARASAQWWQDMALRNGAVASPRGTNTVRSGDERTVNSQPVRKHPMVGRVVKL